MNQCRKCALELSHPRNKQIKVFLKKFCTPVLAITPRGKLISRSKLLLAYHLSRSNNPNSERKQRNESASSWLVFTEVKMLMITLYAEQKKRHRCIEQSFRLCGRRRGWDVSREQH